MSHTFLFIGVRTSLGWELAADEVFQIQKVLRFKPGAKFQVTNGNGWQIDALFVGNVGKKIEFEIVREWCEPSPVFRQILCLGAIKSSNYSSVVPHLVELGCDEFYIFSQGRDIESRSSDKNQDRFGKIVCEAAKVAKRSYFPTFEFHDSLEAVIRRIDSLHPSGLSKFVADQESNQSLYDVEVKDSGCVFVVGSESGLATHELELLDKHSFSKVNLGKYNLRAVTALVAISAVLSVRAQSRGLKWKDVAESERGLLSPIDK